MEKMQKKLLIFVIFCFTLTAGLSAEDKSVFEKYPDAFGGFISTVSGGGISWQHWFDRIGIETTGGFSYSREYYYDETIPEAQTFQYNIGAQIQYQLYNYRFSDWLAGGFYLFGGAGFISMLYLNVPDSQTGYGIGAGLGIGIEPVILGRYSMPLEVGYGATWSGLTSALPDYAGFIIQAGMRYRL